MRGSIFLIALLCAVTSASVVTWNPLCHTYQSPGCFSTGPPGPTDNVIFPAGTNVTFFGVGGNAPGYSPFFAGNLNISKGATVRMTNNEYVVVGNIYVDGTLILDGNVEAPGVGPIGATAYPNLAEEIYGFWAPGFTPRLVQHVNTRLVISGTVSIAGGYASLWSNVTITETGMLNMGPGAQLMGTLENSGTFVGERIYMPMPSVNHVTGRMRIGLALMVTPSWSWAPQSITIHNAGILHFSQSQTTDIMLISVINTGTLIFNVSNSLNWAASSVVNSGNVEWTLDSCNADATFHTPGFLDSLVNSGTVTVCGAAIYATSLVNNGGHFVFHHGGSVHTGSGSGANIPRSLRFECEEEDNVHPRTMLEARAAAGAQCSPKNTSSCPKGTCCDAAGACQPQQCKTMCCASNDACNMYLAEFVYCPPSYGSQERPPVLDKCQYKLAFEDITDEDIHSSFVKNNAITKRYAFFGKTTIGGDGTGFLLTTEPVQLQGSIEILEGGAWHQLVEFKQATTVGGGVITVHRGGRLIAGIDAAADREGLIDVRIGGFMLVPRHAQFSISNTSAVKIAGKLHVDGELHVKGSLLEQKKHLFGEGIVSIIHSPGQ